MSKTVFKKLFKIILYTLLLTCCETQVLCFIKQLFSPTNSEGFEAVCSLYLPQAYFIEVHIGTSSLAHRDANLGAQASIYSQGSYRDLKPHSQRC